MRFPKLWKERSADAAKERYEAYGTEFFLGEVAVLAHAQAKQRLLAGRAHRRYQHATGAQLVQELQRDGIAGGGKDDGVERRFLGPAKLAVVMLGAQVRDAQLAE